MVRPRINRIVRGAPPARYFKPRGIPLQSLRETILPMEGFEALRLADTEGLSQEEAAQHMGISRHTFGRVLNQARQAVSQALVLGWALRIEGGDYCMAEEATIPKSAADGAMGPSPASGADVHIGGLAAGKIAISCEGRTLADLVDTRFGRAAGFLLVDADGQKYEFIENEQNRDRAQGAGIATAELMAGCGAAIVLTGYVGPKAFRALDGAGIKVIQNLDGLRADEALERYNQGDLEFASSPNR